MLRRHHGNLTFSAGLDSQGPRRKRALTGQQASAEEREGHPTSPGSLRSTVRLRKQTNKHVTSFTSQNRADESGRHVFDSVYVGVVHPCHTVAVVDVGPLVLAHIPLVSVLHAWPQVVVFLLQARGVVRVESTWRAEGP